ncbi:MAG TPA: glycosyltransferase family 39 protein [Thermoanaerobaculia bacterium]|nr:glycosyltransferase family 39 protein [Thermoanaerobaculia bacterium]
MVLLFAFGKLLLHLATSSGYGIFRDELYYLACSEQLAAGYVDQPPLSIFVLWLVRHTLGDSLFALRLVPALLGAGTVALVGLLAKELRGGRLAQALAMTAALVAPEYLAFDHFYSMNAFDLFFWAASAWLLARIANGAGPRLWLWLGVVLGLGLLNKISVLWLGAGLAVGLLATAERRWLATRWPWLAGALAAAIFAPHVYWQVTNGWPTLEFIANATGEKMVEVSLGDFVAGQVDMMLPFSLPLWLAGLGYLLGHPEGKKHRLLAAVYLTAFAILAFSGSSRSGYLAPAYTWLFAAGGVAAERWLARPGMLRWRPALAGLAFAVLLAGGAVAAPLVLPVLPVEGHIRWARALGQAPETEEKKELGELGQFFADMHGWEEIVSAVAAAHDKLPAEERAAARVFGPDYGVAGAIDHLGRARGLPPAISGHNGYWLWGPRGWDGRVLIVVGSNEERLRGLFEQVERAGTTDCGYCMPYENGRPIWICRSLKQPVAELWPTVKHFD